MEKTSTFAERRRRLQAEVPQGIDDAAAPHEGEVLDDWNNFPNYFKFGSFANTSVPDTRGQSKSPVN